MAERAVSDVWAEGNPYERYVGRWSRQVAPQFLSWLAAPAGLRWLDVGSGTGALTATILDLCKPRTVIGVEPSEGFLETARTNLAGRAEFLLGDGARIPLPDASVDVVVSGLVLNFVPNAAEALAEMTRVGTPGATIAAYVWDYAGDMQFMRYFWDAVIQLEPDDVGLDEATRFPIATADGLRSAFASAGLLNIEVRAIDIPTVFGDFDDYWQPFLGGQGSAPSYAMALDEAVRDRLREQIRSILPIAEDGSISLIARAWAVRGATKV